MRMTLSDVPRKGVASAQGLTPTDPCTCGSSIAFGACCSPILDGEPAPTAEALMRSRYSAFVLGNENHLFRSWHPRTRPAPPYIDPQITWNGLTIVNTVTGTENDQDGIVEFIADFTHARGHDRLHERSTFTKRGGRWVYVDGTMM